MKKSKLCEYCDPVLNLSSHRLERLEKLWELPARRQAKLRKHSTLVKISPMVFRSLISLGLAVKILRYAKPNYSDGRVNLLAKSAKKKNIYMRSISFNGRPSTLFIATKEDQTIRFELLPTWPLGQLMPVNIDEKPIFKELLEQNNIKVPAGKVFSNYSKAVEYVNKNLKYPVVVKPASGSLSMHVTAGIKNEEELKRAIKVVKIVGRNFVVEEHIEGGVYRLLCIESKLVSAGLRKPPEVTGDGKHSIKQLINIKNRQRRASSLKPIPITTGLQQTLANQGLNLKSVLQKGQRAMLFNKVILSAGAVVEDVTSKVHPEFTKLAEKAAELIDLPVIGFDIIAKDITKPSRDQDFGLIEANSMPFFDMHTNSGKIANQIWQIAFNKKRT